MDTSNGGAESEWPGDGAQCSVPGDLQAKIVTQLTQVSAVLPFDPEGRPVAFDTWHNDLQLYLLSDSRDSVSLFDHVSGAAPAPPATADVSTRSQWLSRDATARLAIRNHLPATECAHFGEHRTAQALYDDVVARYSSPATAAIGKLLLPYLFLELSPFATVADLVTHLRTSDARYRATVPAEFLPMNQPPMFITLYFIVTHLPDSLCSVRDHFPTLDPTSLTVDLLEQHLLAAETSAVAVGAARGTPRSPFFEGCSPSPLSSSFASAAAVPEDVGAASTSTKRRNSKGKGGRGSGGGSGGGGGGSGSGSGGSGRGGRGGGGGGGGGTGGGGGGSGGGGGGSGGSGSSGGSGTSGGQYGPQRGGPGGGRGQQQQRRSETQTPQQLLEWLVQRGAGEGSETCPYVIRTGARAGRTCGRFHTEHRCFARLDDAWRTEFGDDVERPCWAEFLRSGVAIFDLDFDVIISAMYALSFSAEGDCYRCVPPDPGIAAAALGASVSGTPPGTAPAEALHTFTLDSSTSRCFFHDNTTLTPLPAPVPVRLADPSGGPVIASSSTVLPCPAVPSGTLSGLHLPSFSTNLVSTAALQDAMVTTTTPGGQRVSICTCTQTGHHQGRVCTHWLPSLLRSLRLLSKGEVSAVLIPWIRTVRLQLRERFGQDLPVLRLHSDRGGEFSSDLLRDFCRGEGILQSSTFGPVSPCRRPRPHCVGQRRLAMHRCSGSGVLVPLFAIRPRTSSPPAPFPASSLALSLTRLVGSFNTPPCAVSSLLTFDESVPFYRLFPYRSAPSLPPPLFLAPGPPPVDPLPPQGPAPSGVSQVDPLPGTALVQVVVVSGANPGAASGGAASGGAEPGDAGSKGAGSRGAEPEGVEPGGAESEGAEPGGAESEGEESGGAEPRGAASSGGPAGASPRLSSQQLRKWLVQRPHRRSGAPRASEPGDAGTGGAAVTTGAGDPTDPGAAGAGGAGAAGAGAVDPGAGGAGGTVRPRPYFVPLLQQVLGVPSSTNLPPPFLCPPPDQSQPPLQPASPLHVPSPYTDQSGGLTERREPASRPVSPVHTARRAPRLRPPPVPWHSVLPLPTVTRLLATAVTGPSFESAAASALVAELLDFATACRLDYASALVAESVPASPPSVGGESALGTDVLEDRQEDFECLAAAVPRFASLLLAPEGDPDAPDIPTPRSYAEAITGPYSSQWQAAMDAEMASWKSTGTYVDEVPPPGVNIVDGMWIFRVKRPPGSPPAFKARYVARGFSTKWSLRRPVYGLRQVPREWHDTLRTTLATLGFVPSTADPSLFLRTDTSLPPFYVLVYVHDIVFATTDTEALTLVKSKLQKRHTCIDLGEQGSYFGLQITRDRARRTITLTQSHMVHQVLQRFGFQYSSPQLTRLSTSHSLLAPPSDESVEPSGPYPELVGCLMHRKVHWDAAKRVLRYLCSTTGMGLVLGGRGRVVLTGHADASWVDDSATQRSSQGYTFSLGSGSVSWQSTRSSSVLSSSCEAEIYAGAMAAQELRWLTYFLTDLGEQPRSPPVVYVDNKAMIALCQEHRLEHRMKHIALRYFLSRELQQRGQLCLANVATRANTADIFTKALPLGDHQRFVTLLGLVPTLPHLLTV
ncbi:unnamed protein product [Closterium sp. NIES-54]